MLRFLVMRILASIPVLLIMSIITFAIIQAPPGDYGDYIRCMMITQGHATSAVADAAARAVPRGSTASTTRCSCNTSAGSGAWSPAATSATASTTTSRSPRWWPSGCRARIALALVCHLLATVLGITFGISAATRQYSWIDTTLSFVSFLGMTVPRFLMALIILYILAFKLNVQEIGSFFSPKYGGAPWSWDKFVDLVKHVWPVVAIATLRRARLQHAGHARQPARHAERPVRRDRPRQGADRARGDLEARGAERAAPAGRLPGRGAALHADRRGRGRRSSSASPTVGPAIVGSMAIGDVYVTATLLLVLGATLIVGNIIADMLLALLDPRVRLSEG